MTEHRYPRIVILRDLLRAVIGLISTSAPVIFLALNPWLAVVLLSFSSLFVYFGLWTLVKSRMKIVVDKQKIALVSPWKCGIDWCELDGLRLNFYRSGDRIEHGWMQLVLKKGSRKIKVDSRLLGFEIVAREAERASRDNALDLDDTTLENMRWYREVKLV